MAITTGQAIGLLLALTYTVEVVPTPTGVWYTKNNTAVATDNDTNWQNPSNTTFLIDNATCYRDWETDRKSTRLNSCHSAKSRMPSSA